MKLGNYDCTIINDLNIKKKVIDYIFNNLDLSNFRYTILKSVNQLNILKKKPHYVSPNFKGPNYLTIFFKVNMVEYCILIDKRKMSYHREKINIKSLPMYKVNINCNSNIFSGTIFDTKLIKNNKEEYFLLIKDCYFLMNKSFLGIDLIDKISEINSILNNYEINNCKNFKFIVNKLFTYSKLEYVIRKLLVEIKYDTTGIIFYSSKSGHSYIFLNNSSETIQNNISIKTTSDKTYDIITNYEEFLKSRVYSYESTGVIKELWLKKNIYPDVYDIYENNLTNRLGIAYIPNLKISRYCNKKITSTHCVKFKCIFNEIFNKWIPLKAV